MLISRSWAQEDILWRDQAPSRHPLAFDGLAWCVHTLEDSKGPVAGRKRYCG